MHDQIVHAHCNEVDTNTIVLVGFDCQFELGPDAVVRGHQQRVAIACSFQVEEASKSAEFRIRSRPRGRPGERAEDLNQRIAGIDRYSGIGVGEGLVAHSSRALETSRLDFHAVVVKRRHECCAAAF